MGEPKTTLLRVVAIDGPCGAGKSAVARQVAARMAWSHLDTGAMYRSVTWLALQQGIDLKDGAALERLALAIELKMATQSDGSTRLWCGSEEITSAIRGPQVSVAVSEVADQPGVRRALVAKQREIGRSQPSVLEGRDISTVVFPDARWKFFLEADGEVRARRRFDQWTAQGIKADMDEVRRELRERDRRDLARPVGALRIVPDAIVLDTTFMPESQVVDLIVAMIRSSDPQSTA